MFLAKRQKLTGEAPKEILAGLEEDGASAGASGGEGSAPKKISVGKLLVTSGTSPVALSFADERGERKKRTPTENQTRTTEHQETRLGNLLENWIFTNQRALGTDEFFMAGSDAGVTGAFSGWFCSSMVNLIGPMQTIAGLEEDFVGAHFSSPGGGGTPTSTSTAQATPRRRRRPQKNSSPQQERNFLPKRRPPVSPSSTTKR